MLNKASLDLLTDIFVLEEIKGFGPQKFKEVYSDGLSFSDLLSRPREMQRFGKRGKDFADQLNKGGSDARQRARDRAKKQLDYADANDAYIITYYDEFYPKILLKSNVPIPALYARGNISSLRGKKSVAGVGSRNIREPYSGAHDAFCRAAIARGFTIVSGFATGADMLASALVV